MKKKDKNQVDGASIQNKERAFGLLTNIMVLFTSVWLYFSKNLAK